MSERTQITSSTGITVIHHASGQSEPSVVPATAPVVTGKESVAANGSVTHPTVIGTLSSKDAPPVKFSNPA